MALGPEQEEVTHIAKSHRGVVDEVGEAGMGRSDEPPHHPRHDQSTHDVACPDVDLKEIVLGKVGNGEGNHQSPMEQPDEAIPNVNLGFVLS